VTCVTDPRFTVRDNENEANRSMKLKILVIILTLSLASLAQTGSQPATPAQDSKACACCTHDKAEAGSKAACPDCCKDGKCPMMSGSHAAMKCPMMSKDGKMADGKMCCSSNKCAMHGTDDKAGGCCCGNMDDQKPAGM
jgi:hypothetical protein